MREYAILFWELSLFACIDDKHRVKVGEPNFPVAAVERGKEVIDSTSNTLAFGDHGFTKFSLIPSVVLIVDIPEWRTVHGIQEVFLWASKMPCMNHHLSFIMQKSLAILCGVMRKKNVR